VEARQQIAPEPLIIKGDVKSVGIPAVGIGVGIGFGACQTPGFSSKKVRTSSKSHRQFDFDGFFDGGEE